MKEIIEDYEYSGKRIRRDSTYHLKHRIELLKKEISQLTERKEKLELSLRKEIAQITLRKEKIENLELSLNIYQLIEQKDMKEIKKLLLSIHHKKVLRILFMYYDQQESEITFLYDQFDHTFQFRAPIRANEDKMYKELIFKLRKPPIKHKTMIHLPDSEWYAKKKSIKEQGES